MEFFFFASPRPRLVPRQGLPSSERHYPACMRQQAATSSAHHTWPPVRDWPAPDGFSSLHILRLRLKARSRAQQELRFRAGL